MENTGSSNQQFWEIHSVPREWNWPEVSLSQDGAHASFVIAFGGI
jgi:hypothetical protein